MKKLQMIENFKSKWIFFSLANLNITYYKIFKKSWNEN